MSKPSGMRLGVQSYPNQTPDQEYFENQFLENEEDIEQGLKNNNNITQSQYLPKKQNDSVDKLQKKENEEKRIKKLNNGMQRLSVSILEMKQKYKDLDMQEVLFKKRNEKKENQIRQFLSQKKKQKVQIIKKRKRRMERQAKSLQESIFIEQKKEKQQKMKPIQQNLKKLKQLKQIKQKQEKEKAQKLKIVSEMFSKIHQYQKKHPKFHLRKQDQQKRNIQKERQNQKQFLAKRKENFKPIQAQQFQLHSKKYQQLLEQLESVKKAQRQQKYLRIVQENKKFEQIHRGPTYDYVVSQKQSLKEKKEQPMQKYKKIKNYQQYVRQNFKPSTQGQSIQIKNDSQIQINEKHSSLSHRQVKRYKYLHGVSYGEIIQNKPVAKSEAEKRKIGIGYLAYMRSLPKRRYDDLFIKDQQQMLAQMKMKEKKPNPLAQRSGRKSLQVKISEKPTREELGMRIKQLKQKDEQIKMKEKVVRCSDGSSPMTNTKQIGDQLIFNIQRKLNLLSKLDI